LEKLKEFTLKNNESHIKLSQIFSQTIDQSQEKLWFEECSKRLTASNFGKICKKRQSTHCRGLVFQILYGQFEGNFDKIEYLQYGKSNEEIGRKRYEKIKNLDVEKTRLWIHPTYQWLGCSPDGLIKDEEGEGLLEIKWIAKKKCRDQKIHDILKENNQFCIEISDHHRINVKKNHNYFYQVHCLS